VRDQSVRYQSVRYKSVREQLKGESSAEDFAHSS